MPKLAVRSVAAFVVALLGVHCSGDSGSAGSDAPACVSGDTRECVGPGQCEGAQECNDEGTGWTTCDCGSGTGGETSGAGGESASGGNTAGGGTSATGGMGEGGSGGTDTGGSGGEATGGGGTGGEATGGTGSGGGATCSDVGLSFAPQAPTVYVLVDQSGSIYDVNAWVPLRDAILPVIQEHQADVRFGFGSFTGTQAQCTGLNDAGSIARDNYDAIAAHYTSLSTTNSANQETPTVKALEQAIHLLEGETVPGTRSILLVTADDDVDFCDDPAPDCGTDAVVATLQTAAAEGIDTYVYALNNSGIDTPAWLDFWAQAGIGEQPNWPKALSVTQYNGDIYDMCTSNASWKALWNSLGKTTYTPSGTYSTAGGTAQAFLDPDVLDVASAMESRIESLKSCVFDLTTPDVTINPGAKGDGVVFVGGNQVPAAEWKLNSATQIELVGAACATWKADTSTEFFVGFPCSAFIIQ